MFTQTAARCQNKISHQRNDHFLAVEELMAISRQWSFVLKKVLAIILGEDGVE